MYDHSRKNESNLDAELTLASIRLTNANQQYEAARRQNHEEGPSHDQIVYSLEVARAEQRLKVLRRSVMED